VRLLFVSRMCIWMVQLLSWVHELMLQRQRAGGLCMPAPILARVIR
jgi:hypothetical protein